MGIGCSAIGTTAIGAGGAQIVMDAIKLTSKIPQSAQDRFEEFIDSLPKKVLDSFEQLLEVELPPDLYEYADIFFSDNKELNVNLIDRDGCFLPF